MAHNKLVRKKKGGKNMSPKELLYIEDALAHMKFMKDKCNHAASEITDANLKQLIDKLGKKNQKMFDSIYAVVVGHAKGEK